MHSVQVEVTDRHYASTSPKAELKVHVFLNVDESAYGSEQWSIGEIKWTQTDV